MIQTATTFVIGAGASCSYGLPTGNDLKKFAATMQADDDAFRLAAFALQKHSIDRNRLISFQTTLKHYPEDSIDAFLEKQRSKPEMVRMGKTLIAAIMGRSLVSAKESVAVKEDWLLHVVQKMLAGPQTPQEFISNNRVKFLTFNFDTFVEKGLRTLITQGFPGEDVQAAINAFPVTHIHGKLAPIPNLPMKVDDYFGKHTEWIEWINTAANSINVTSDEIPRETLQTTRSAIGEAGVLAFLGFSYNRANLTRLGLPDIFETAKEPAKLFGSAKGLTQTDCENVSALLLGRIVLRDLNCREVFNVLRIIRDA